jgi:hypothetical protein
LIGDCRTGGDDLGVADYDGGARDPLNPGLQVLTRGITAISV